MYILDIIYTNEMFIINSPNLARPSSLFLQYFRFKSQHVLWSVSIFDGEHTTLIVYKLACIIAGLSANETTMGFEDVLPSGKLT
jgi:hypothetical protein